jgi:general stress protein 26
VKQHHHENPQDQAHALRQFNAVAAQTNLMVLSSVDAEGQPSSRVMRFVKTDRPGVWYAATAPDSPKVHEVNEGNDLDANVELPPITP